jgi:hypothetical protein
MQPAAAHQVRPQHPGILHDICPQSTITILTAPDGSYQQPILALITPCGPSPDRLAFTWRELRTFVHEMGHAVHNMASRTHFQHLWGTRCAQVRNCACALMHARATSPAPPPSLPAAGSAARGCAAAWPRGIEGPKESRRGFAAAGRRDAYLPAQTAAVFLAHRPTRLDRFLQDVVEIPSHLWEHFVTDHRAVSVIARHAASREPLPRALHSALLASHGAFPALDLQQQVEGQGGSAAGRCRGQAGAKRSCHTCERGLVCSQRMQTHCASLSRRPGLTLHF